MRPQDTPHWHAALEAALYGLAFFAIIYALKGVIGIVYGLLMLAAQFGAAVPR